MHPAYDTAFDGFAAPEVRGAAPEVRGNPKARQEWAVNQLMMAAKASKNLGLDRHVTFSGALAWPYVYDGNQFLINLIKMESIFVMKFILVKIFMMVLHLKCF